MKKVLSFFTALSILAGVVFSSVASASTIYLPTEDSDEYLPTVKIFAYALSYDGSVMAEAYGSGTLIDDKGTILTNDHVIVSMMDPTLPDDAFQVCLTKSNDPEEPICRFTASLIARDSERDVALLKMDSTDVKGTKITFDFFLPYANEADYKIGDSITVIGYPDTGGKTITYTSGLVSGFITESGLKFIKTDADISFGNSGGTAVDESGNFIGIPESIFTSYSSESLGYLIPLDEIVAWINANKNNEIIKNDAADAALKNAMLANINANDSGIYKNDYPPYEISLVDGWKFGNSLEGSFEGGGYGYVYGADSVIIYPVDSSDMSQLFVSVSVTDYAYDVTLEDIEYVLGSYSESMYIDPYATEDTQTIDTYERVDLNDKYSAVKETYSYYDWWYYQYINTVTYYVPYGDKVINVSYTYTDGNEDELAEVEEIIGTFAVDMSKIESSVVNVIESEDPKIKITNPLDGVYLSDATYEYDGVKYFGASFGKKKDYSFYITIYSNEYWNEAHIGNFDQFKTDTIAEAETWYEIVSQGDLKIDGHDGFFYTDKYDDGYGYVSIYTTMYVESDDNTYFSIYYSGDDETYDANLDDFKLILKNIELSNGGSGKYTIPSFSTSDTLTAVLSDIENYVYEDSIRGLKTKGAFGEKAPYKFEPANALNRKDFVVWAVKTLQGEALTAFTEYQTAYTGCTDVCFEDVSKDSEDAVYIDFAYSRGAIGGMSTDGKYYFSPEAQISLMAALKIIFELYDYKIWVAPSFVPWYMPYLQLGYKEYVIPYGVDSASYLLTRGEGAYIIDSVANKFMYSDYYYDDVWY